MHALIAGLSVLASTASAATGVGSVPKLPDTVKNATAPDITSTSRHAAGFVTVKDGHFFLNGQLSDFRTMNAPNLIGSGADFENIDTYQTFRGFAVPFTRTYILTSVATEMFPNGQSSASGSMITGWNRSIDDWNYNEAYLVRVDNMLASAAEYGVKIIIPIINQDYGEGGDWFGTFTDLIRHRFGIPDYHDANVAVDWFESEEMLRVFKKIITKALTRKNTVNGRVWGADDTVLAWETGNEMNHGIYDPTNSSNTVYQRPAPANWTISVTQHLKELAPNTLTMDGSFSRICSYTEPTCLPLEENSWPTASLQSKYVDLFSVHYYRDAQIPLFRRFAEYVRAHGKTFVIGEMGFFSTPAYYGYAWGNMTDIPVAGGMMWSMRPHADSNGFLTHTEEDGVYSYHFPGWNRSPAPDFQKGESHISRQTYFASYEAVHKSAPPFPIPAQPVLKDASNKTAGPGVTWRGGAWAKKYELWAASVDAPYFSLVGDDLRDNVDAGTLFIPVDPSNAGHNITVKLKNSEQPDVIDWHDTKWDDAGVHIPDTSARLLRRSEVVAPETERMMKKRSSSEKGAWYVVRGLSDQQNIPGPFSSPVFVAAAANSTSS